MSAEQISESGSQAIEDAAAAWLWRQSAAEWNDKDQTDLDAWLAESHTHLAVFWRLEVVWNRAERLKALRQNNSTEGAVRGRARLWTILGTVAATLAVAGILTVGSVSLSKPPQTFSTDVGGRATIKLADGSRVELNTNTTLRAIITPRGRTIALERGEAYFQIQHDSARPFVVLVAGHRVVDLGTKFTVRTVGDGLKVTLVEGRARLESVNANVQSHSTDLTPGEVVVATANSMSISRQGPQELADALSWKRGLLVFKHEALANAANEFNRYNRVKIVVDPTIATLKINGTFEADSVEAFTRMARFAMKLQVERTDEEIRLAR